ncbi:hypothetical protein M2360_002505 [Rhizobium sp. SG_E_25_P2]|uniref:hypothetical protein n=1 Tax=Rhizobium sp. SG_E_25_P2 TaxID=2879942 RepID=UPI0024762C4A|nr:hypothetical protein [Rhizobium sp. SG_E_25_P2]MDH6267108.1 hypothetical protein [Rhizobium sp. SG_E_25_P2]
MKRLILAATSACLGFQSAEAAVSGYYDSVEQIGIILGSALVADAVHQAPIGAISNTGTREDGAKEWTIRVQDCDLTVYLIPVLPEGPGKTTYRLDIPRTCQ